MNILSFLIPVLISFLLGLGGAHISFSLFIVFVVVSMKVKRSTIRDDIRQTKIFKIKDDLIEQANLYRGTLYMRIGPMFSGKTTWLNSELTKLSETGFRSLKIIHSDDIREDVESCDDSGSTHNPSYNVLSRKIHRLRCSELSTIDVNDYDVVGIDESQFFPDLLDVVINWVEKQGKHVKISGLDGDSFRGKFGQTLDLIPYCDEVVKLNATCKICSDELKGKFHGNILAINGSFTKRTCDSIEQKVIGGSSQYIPVCRYHFHQTIIST